MCSGAYIGPLVVASILDTGRGWQLALGAVQLFAAFVFALGSSNVPIDDHTAHTKSE